MSIPLSQSKGLPISEYLAQHHNLNERLDVDDSSAQIPINLYLTNDMLKKFINNIKSQIRGSLEYRLWTNWFRQIYAPEICCASGNIVNIEIHHHPLVLEDYVDLAFLYLYNNGIAYTTMSVADIVMRFHYENIVGAVFISETYHVRFHDLHDINIPETAVKGDFEKLINHPILGNLLAPNLKAKISLNLPDFSSKYKEYFYK